MDKISSFFQRTHLIETEQGEPRLMVGSLDPDCEVGDVVQQAYDNARFLCEQVKLRRNISDLIDGARTVHRWTVHPWMVKPYTTLFIAIFFFHPLSPLSQLRLHGRGLSYSIVSLLFWSVTLFFIISGDHHMLGVSSCC